MPFPRDAQGGMVTGWLFALEEAKQEKMGSWLRTVLTAAFSHCVSEYKMCPRPPGLNQCIWPFRISPVRRISSADVG